jgi:drug/metabolite transporter (DMT)-like permease
LNRLTSIHIGLGCCIASAIGYALANTMLRSLSTAVDVPHVLTLFVKESVTTVLVGSAILVLTLLKRFSWPERRCIKILIFAGIVTQVGGNIPVLWSFSVIGMSVAAPIYLGMNLVGSAILGRIILKEPVCLRTICAIGLLVLSVILLNLGGIDAPDLKALSLKQQILGTGAAVLGGFCFAILAVSIRYALLTSKVPQAASFWTVVFMIPAAGTYILGPLFFAQSGMEVLVAVPLASFGKMLLAGLANFAAFALLSQGLKMVPVVLVNIANTTQVAMGALLGIFLFQEKVSVWLIAGLLTAMAGVLLIGSKNRRRKKKNGDSESGS